MPGMKYFLAILVLCLLSSTLFAEELRLEGVLEDLSGKTPAIAMINEIPYQAGDSLGILKVTEVKANYVKLTDSAGIEHTLFLRAAAPPAIKDVKPVPLPAPSKPFWEKARNSLWEVKAVNDLAAVNNASVRYYEKNRFFPCNIRQLTLDGFLPASYEHGQAGKYNFYFANVPMKPDDLQLHGDPLEPSTGMRYFFVGPDAVIHSSATGVATEKSPVHKSFGGNSRNS